MANLSSLERARAALAQMKEDYRHGQVNRAIKKAGQQLYMRTECFAQLEMSKEDMDRIIRNQSAEILRGRQEGMDTSSQENLLKEATLGYILLRKTIYQLKSAPLDEESIALAYDLLDTAITRMQGRPVVKNPLAFLTKKNRSAQYEVLTSEKALREDEALCESIQADLIVNGGDIEASLKKARKEKCEYSDGTIGYTVQSGGKETSSLEALRAQVQNLPDDMSIKDDGAPLDLGNLGARLDK